MKGINKIIITIAALAINTISMGYTWSFANFTDKTIQIQLFLAAGPSETRTINPGQQGSIGWEVPNFYAGFCLSSIRYRDMATVQKFGPNAAWREVNVKWITNDGLALILEASSSIGSGLQSVGTAAAKMAAAAQTGGASELGSSATDAQQAMAAKNDARAQRMSGMADGAQSADLGGLISGIGKAVSVSGCRGRHYEIFADENGFYFTTLQQ